MRLVRRHSNHYSLSDTHDSGNYGPWGNRNMELQVLRVLKSCDSSLLSEGCCKFIPALHKKLIFLSKDFLSQYERCTMKLNYKTEVMECLGIDCKNYQLFYPLL